jgi:hypothetical protein
MSEDSNAERKISLGDDFGNVVVEANGAKLFICKDGHVQSYPDIRE